MKKIITPFAFILLIAPSIAFASWWNPFSWNIFSRVFHPSSVSLQKQVASSTPNQNTPTILENKTNSQTKTNNTTPPPTPQKTPVKAPIVQTGTLCNGVYYSDCPAENELVCPTDGEKASCQPLPNTVMPVQTQISQPQNTQPSGTYCNGKYWNSCPSGQNFICPQSGDAYCQTPAQAQAVQDQQAQYQAQQQKNSAINQQISDLQQQILDIKTQYYIDSANIDKTAGFLAQANGLKQKLLTDDNNKIDQLTIQIQQLKLQMQ